MTGIPRRVRVTSPQTRIALSRGHRPVRHLLPLPGPGAEDERELAAARELFIAQRRHAVRTLALLGALLFGLSGLLGALPVLGRITVAGVPASWLLLMAASYPMLLLIAVGHVRAAERVERASGRGPG
ncbi:hypothetical protein E1265_16085 [Streptomyces sp. 8K308]|uniref:hypothetical protein n=1 Tax=Streptomyces sp. 8K308 TaxID=2530388 RepID=UPI001047688E|nr:hypothetical protein [Streptomyces sp. 8K308]TDC22256.1 hypothetical protein E1265_16085 [Streptomyces sp. 8K308]